MNWKIKRLETDWKSQQTIKMYFDEDSKAQESSLKVGDTVILKQKKSNKLSTRFENKKYTIIQKKGNSVTLKSEEGEVKVRNSRGEIIPRVKGRRYGRKCG